MGRFINGDDVANLGAEESLTGFNLFTYCANNPVNRFDYNGNWSMPNWAKNVVAAVAVVAVVAAVAVATVATAGAGTAAAFIAVGAAKGAAAGMVSGAVIGAATGAVTHRLSTGSWNGADAAALIGMGKGALSGAITGALTGGLTRGAQVARNTRVSNARSLPKTGKPLSSQTLVKNGNATQTRYYNWRGQAKWDIDFTNHGTPNVHSMPHAHKWGASGRSGPLNTISGLGWW